MQDLIDCVKKSTIDHYVLYSTWLPEYPVFVEGRVMSHKNIAAG